MNPSRFGFAEAARRTSPTSDNHECNLIAVSA